MNQAERLSALPSQLAGILSEPVERALMDFVIEKWSGLSEAEASKFKHLLTMEKLSEGRLRGIRVAALPYMGSFEIWESDVPGTNTVRYVTVREKRGHPDEIREYYNEKGVGEEDIKKALERAWRKCEKQSGVLSAEEAHEPRHSSAQ